MALESEEVVFCEEGKVFLNMSMTQNAFAKARLSEHLSDNGVLVTKQDGTWKFEGWHFTGTQVRQNGRSESVLFSCDACKGKTLSTYLNEKNTKAARRALEALEQANLQSIKLPNIGAGGIFISEDLDSCVKILFLPVYLFTLAASCLGDDASCTLNKLYIRSDLKEGAAVNFTQAVLAYFIVTGTLPFTQTKTNKLHEDILDANFLPLEYLEPEVPQKLSFFVDNALKRSPKIQLHKKSSAAPKNSLKEKMARQITEELSVSQLKPKQGLRFPFKELDEFLSSDKRESIPQKIQAVQSSITWKSFCSKLKTKRWFRKNSTILSVIGSVLVVIIFADLSYQRGQQNNPTTQGLSSLEATEFFYSSYNSLNITGIQQSSKGSEMRQIEDTVSAFYVSEKTREAYGGGKEKTYCPAEWFWRNGEMTYSIYGFTQFTIDQKPASLYAEAPKKKDKIPALNEEKNATQTHDVHYYFLYNEGEDVLHVMEHTDRVHLTFSGKAWLVTGIDSNVSETLIPLKDFKQSFADALKKYDEDALDAVLSLSDEFYWLSTEQELLEAKQSLIKSDVELSGYTFLQ